MTENSDFKKISSTFFDDEAIELELLEKSLRIDKLGKVKSERDKAFLRLAFSGLKFAMDSYKSANAIKYPSAEQLSEFFASLKLTC